MSGEGQLPDGWVWTTLEGLLAAEARAITDGPFGSNLKSAHYTDSGARVLRLQNVGDGVFRDERAYISLDHYENLKMHNAQAGDLLLASLGEELPRVALVPELDGPAIVKADVIRARLHPAVDRRWVLYALQAPASRAVAMSKIRGVGRPRLGLGEIRKLPIPLPPIAEQRRIVEALEDHLSRLDAAQRGLASALRRTRALRETILTQAVLGQFPTTRSSNAADDREKLPDGWTWTTLEQVATVQGGIQKQQKRRPTRNRFPFLRVANVGRGSLDLGDVHEVELFEGEIERFRLSAGDLLVVEGNGSPDQIGRAAMWRGQIADCVHQNHLIRVRPGPVLDPAYLEYTWNSSEIVRQLKREASSTSGLHTLSTAKVKRIQIPLPPLDAQKNIVNDIAEQFAMIDHLVESSKIASQRADRFRRALLTEAFSGRLVPQSPADEPASELLVRIAAERASLSASKVKPVPRARTTATTARPPKKTTTVPAGIQEELPL